MEITTGKNEMGKEKQNLIEVNKTKKGISLIFIWVCIFLLIFETYIFMAGFNSVDVYHNAMNFAYNLNIAQDNLRMMNITDTGLNLQTKPIEYYYISGLRQMTLAFFSGLITMLLLCKNFEGRE